ncbi:alpha/beta fold hydrolase [Micromonospora sp. DH14]|uniref:alpha/beta fold hydrolase n=1 Tax=Micromonospora sp. DH14 TaxID=3040120 RepID=UPI002441A853|nr:alpha/beta fold hydrolase [Micromonospora sp. DH14]MDG9675977.1 alpha/beta fold hydrolase [Micromonospora sp. DH14]
MSIAPDMSAQGAGMPTVVLVHGAFAGSSSWNGVIADLRRRGYPVIAVANPLRGVQKDAAYVRALLDSLPGPVVMAAHSYGGLVMTEAADGAANVKALVYVASVSPEVGESVIGLLGKYPGSQLATSIAMVEIPADGGGTTMDQYILQRFLADRAGSTTVEIAASHAVAVSRPGPVADLIDSAARATMS